MFTLNSLLTALTDADKIRFEGVHYRDGSQVYTGDLWRIWPAPKGERLESKKWNRLQSLMEKRDMQLRFDDELISDDNGKVHEINPGYHGQVATYQVIGDSVWSQEEGQETHTDDYIEALLKQEFKGRSDRWLTDEQFEERGFIKFYYEAESGFHHGQNDTPDSVVERLKSDQPDATDFIFQIDDVGQFDMHFHLWYRMPEKEEEEEEEEA